MTEHETLPTAIKAAVPRLQPYEVEALAAHLERVGFRKTVELGELDTWFRPGVDTFDDNKQWYDADQVRRLAAPKEREPVVWKRFTSVGNFHCEGCDYSGIIAGDPERSGVKFCAGCGHPVTFTPTNPAQREGS